MAHGDIQQALRLAGSLSETESKESDAGRTAIVRQRPAASLNCSRRWRSRRVAPRRRACARGRGRPRSTAKLQDWGQLAQKRGRDRRCGTTRGRIFTTTIQAKWEHIDQWDGRTCAGEASSGSGRRRVERQRGLAGAGAGAALIQHEATLQEVAGQLIRDFLQGQSHS